MIHVSKITVVLVITLLLSVTGCSSRRSIEVYYVEGTASLDNAPLYNAHVTFVPKEGSTSEQAGGFTLQDGAFKVSSTNGDPETGAMLGEYAVVFSKVERPPGASPGAMPVETLPRIYANPKTTPFNVTAVKGRNKNKFEFALQSK